MARRLVPALLALLALVLPLAACGADEDDVDVAEGEPIVVDDVSYNVVISRFLNPDDEEDSAYVEGQPEPEPGQQYFGVFMQIKNDSDEEVELPADMNVVDTLDNSYSPIESHSPFALPLGGEVLPAGDEVPVPNSIAADGPTQGSLVLFLLDQESTENRPLELELPLPGGETGVIELDI